MPRDVMTVRLDRALRSRLQVAAKRRSLSASAAARMALEGWLETEEEWASSRPYEQMADLVGCARGGDRGRSTRGWTARPRRRSTSGRRR